MTYDTDTETTTLNGDSSDAEEFIAKEMNRQYRRKMRDKNADKAQNSHEQNEPPDDPNINRRTGKVLGFDVGRQDIIHIDVLTHTGYVTTQKVRWPDDPTDETEDFVRLCRWLDVPMTDISQLKGAYVPLRMWGKGIFKDHDEGSKLQLEIPPIDAPGNRLKYRVHRYFQTHRWVNYAVPALLFGVVCFAWVPIHLTVGIFPTTEPGTHEAVIPFVIGILGGLSFVSLSVALSFCMLIALFYVHEVLFPKADGGSL